MDGVASPLRSQMTCPATPGGGPAWAPAMPVAARALLSGSILPDRRRKPGRAFLAIQTPYGPETLCPEGRDISWYLWLPLQNPQELIGAIFPPGLLGWELGPCFWVATSEEQAMGCSAHWQTFHICKVGMRRPILCIGRVCVRPAEITQPVTRLGSGYGPPRWRMQH